MKRPVRRGRAFLASVLGAACISAVSGSGTPAAASGTPSPPAALTGWHGDADCTLLQPTRVWRVNPDGTTLGPDATDAQKAAAGTAYEYSGPGGTTMTTVDPPAGFSPATASVQTDRALGWDPPTDPAAVVAWRDTFAGYEGTIRSVPCVGKTIIGGPEVRPTGEGGRLAPHR